MNRLKLEGKTFGRLKVLKFYDVRTRKGNKKETRWLCICECGKKVVLVGSNLKEGKTRSCGCLQKENSITHGLSHDPLYGVWKAMLRRCENKEDANYHHYGGRGVKVAKEWNELDLFYKWALKNGYKEGLEIDRIDNDGDYEPSNVRFTTRRENMLNTRRNINVTINGITKTLTEWADQYNIKINTMQYRYYRGDRGDRLIRPTQEECRTEKAKGMV